MNKFNIAKLAWLAGLLEGEGSFDVGMRSNRCWWRIRCEMTDPDVVNRIYEFVGAGHIYYNANRLRITQGYKPTARWELCDRASVISLLKLLYPYMGLRRKTQIKRMLKRAEEFPAREGPKHGTLTMYTNYKCRCEPCKNAHNVYDREHYRRVHATKTA